MVTMLKPHHAPHKQSADKDVTASQFPSAFVLFVPLVAISSFSQSLLDLSEILTKHRETKLADFSPSRQSHPLKPSWILNT